MDQLQLQPVQDLWNDAPLYWQRLCPSRKSSNIFRFQAWLSCDCKIYFWVIEFGCFQEGEIKRIPTNGRFLSEPVWGLVYCSLKKKKKWKKAKKKETTTTTTGYEIKMTAFSTGSGMLFRIWIWREPIRINFLCNCHHLRLGWQLTGDRFVLLTHTIPTREREKRKGRENYRLKIKTALLLLLLETLQNVQNQYIVSLMIWKSWNCVLPGLVPSMLQGRH